MTIAWTAFTPWSALLGGGLIGAAAGLLLFFNGRIAGISGVLGGLLRPLAPGDGAWRVAFVAGLLLAPLAYLGFAAWPAVVVGVGTRYGAGCTSGHGVCGIARLSLRSLVATLCFMAAGFATVYVLRHLLA